MARNINAGIIDTEIEGIGDEILQAVELQSFTLSPETIEPFDESHLSWVVTGPPNKFSVQLNGANVSPSGSATVNPVFSKQYDLIAKALGSAKFLGRVTLNVDHDSCVKDTISQATIQAFIQSEVDKMILQDSEISLRNPVTVKLDEGRMDISLQFYIDINNFFNADLDVKLKFRIGLAPDRRVRAQLIDVDSDAKFSVVEHILSLGSASAFQAMIQEMATAFIESLMGPELERKISGGIQDYIDNFLKNLKRTDNRITYIHAEDGFLDFECCGNSEQGTFSDVVNFNTLAIG